MYGEGIACWGIANTGPINLVGDSTTGGARITSQWLGTDKPNKPNPDDAGMLKGKGRPYCFACFGGVTLTPSARSASSVLVCSFNNFSLSAGVALLMKFP